MIIRFEKLSKFYLESCALRDATGNFEQGEKILVVGENGSGKSTLLKILSGQITPTSGKVFLNDSPIKAGDRTKFSVLGESKFLYLDLTIRENLSLSLREKKEFELAEELSGKFSLSLNNENTIRHLSSGQKQKAALIRALTMESEVLVLDEPLNFLDSDARKTLSDILLSLSKTIILTGHENDYFANYRKVQVKAGVLTC